MVTRPTGFCGELKGPFTVAGHRTGVTTVYN